MKSSFKSISKVIIVGLSMLLLTTPTGLAKNLRLLSAYPKNMAFVEGCIGAFNSNLTKESKGKLKTRYSGPDVIPTVEQFQPLQSGVFDLLFTIGAYHLGTTAIGAVVDTMNSDPAKRRQHGILKYIDQHYQKYGVKVVAIIPVTDLHFLTRVPLDGRSPSFSGLKLRTAPTAVPMVKILGGSPVNMAPGEVYTSLQKGVIDGTVMISYGAWNYKWHEVTKYMVRPSFSFLSTYIFMNLNKYKALSVKERRAIDEAGRLTELEAFTYFKDKKAVEIAKLKSSGLKETFMQASDAKRINQIINNTVWAFATKKSGKAAKELRALAIKTGMAQ